MWITLEPFSDDPLCAGNRCTLLDKKRLSEYVAQLLLGQFLHVSRLLEGVTTAVPPTTIKAIDEVIQLLSTPGTENARWQRDGWVFQMISWVVARHSESFSTAIGP